MVRKTKIICTLGPATEKAETLRQLIQKGADVFRFNMSHAEHGWVRESVERIRQLSAKIGHPVAILLDTQGPAIRTGDLKSEFHFKQGDILELTIRGAKPKEKYSVDVNYGGLINDVSVGDSVLVDSGLIKLAVIGKKSDRVRCQVVTPGTLGSRRHINLPGVHVNLPPLTKKDIARCRSGRRTGGRFCRVEFRSAKKRYGRAAADF